MGNQDPDLPQSPAEIAAKSALQHQLAAICMECLEKSQGLAEKFDSIKDDECSKLRTMSPRKDECSTATSGVSSPRTESAPVTYSTAEYESTPVTYAAPTVSDIIEVVESAPVTYVAPTTYTALAPL